MLLYQEKTEESRLTHLITLKFSIQLLFYMPSFMREIIILFLLFINMIHNGVQMALLSTTSVSLG